MKAKSSFGKMDIFSCFFVLILAMGSQLVAGAFLHDWIVSIFKDNYKENLLMFLSFTDFFMYFVLIFVVVFPFLFLIRKKYRIIGATLLLCAEMFFLISNLNFRNYVLFLNSIVQLSAGATGAILAIYLHSLFIGKQEAKGKKESAPINLSALLGQQIKNAEKKKPALPKFLLWLSVLSVPATYFVLILSSFIVVGWSIWGLVLVLQLPRIPIVILIALGAAPLIALGTAINALWTTFNSKPHFEPAIILSKWETLQIKAVVKEVCEMIKTELPHNILLHAEPTFFVSNAKMNTFDGVVKGRTLAIGVPLFMELSTQELKAVLAHEFAHFSGNDTLYSLFVAPVYKSLGSAVNELSNFGRNDSSSLIGLIRTLLLLPLLFVTTFFRYFATIDRILSRTRELRADWYAANCFGTNAMTKALLKVHEISAHFSEKSNDLAQKEADNFFDVYSTSLKSSVTELEKYRNTQLAEEDTDFDTHPSLAQRITEMPYTPQTEGFDKAAVLLINDLTSERLRLGKLYTDQFRQIKTHVEKVEAKQTKQLEDSIFVVSIANPKKLGENRQFVNAIAAFDHETPEKVEQCCKKLATLSFSKLTYQRACELVEIIKPYTTSYTVAEVAQPRFHVIMSNPKKLAENQQLINAIAAFDGEDPAQVTNFFKTSPSVGFTYLSQKKAERLVEILKAHTKDFRVQAVQ